MPEGDPKCRSYVARVSSEKRRTRMVPGPFVVTQSVPAPSQQSETERWRIVRGAAHHRVGVTAASTAGKTAADGGRRDPAEHRSAHGAAAVAAANGALDTFGDDEEKRERLEAQ